MLQARALRLLAVYCHIGSLEMFESKRKAQSEVYCHIGSLERTEKATIRANKVYCHIGSLERLVFLRQ